jgi:hypothetical protein
MPLMPLTLLLACQLTEVTVPVGQPRVIVQAVLSRTAARQFVVVERSITGESGGSGFGGDEIPPNGPTRPIEGAVVILEYPAGTACGPAADTLPPLSGAPGVYQAEGLCTPAAGDGVSLRVVTPDGVVVTGRTTVPGAERVSVVVAGDSAPPAPARVLLDRDRDTLDLAALPISARAMQVEARRGDSLPDGVFGQDDLVLYLVTDSLGLRLPGDLINPFETDEGEAFFKGGFSYDLTVVLADTNYYDFVRSRSNPLTGRGFINRLEGGIGVFGSVETHGYRMRVVARVDDPREGVYRLRGTVAGRAVDVTWELYLDPVSEGAFGAFVQGSWDGAPVDRSAEGRFGGAPVAGSDDFFAGFELPVDGASSLEQWQFSGRRASDGVSFPVQVVGFTVSGNRVVGSLNAVQVSGPAR